MITHLEVSRGGGVFTPFVCVSVCFSAGYLKHRCS